MLFHWSLCCAVILNKLDQSLTKHTLQPRLLPQVLELVILHTFSIVKNFSMVKSIYLMKRLINPNHVILPRSRLYTLILIFPDTTSHQILGSEPVIWDLNNTGNSLRKPIIIKINNNNKSMACKLTGREACGERIIGTTESCFMVSFNLPH